MSARVTLDQVTKKFGSAAVVEDVTVRVRPGRVTVLLGENGAGKSTLIKMMSGVYQPDGGRILIDGAPVTLPNVRAAEAHGIAAIHQELNLVPTMSVAENVLLGQLSPPPQVPARFFPRKLLLKQLRRRAQAALDQIGLKVPLDTPVGELGIAQQQLVEIAKALSLNARTLILDEPTAALSGDEIDTLFRIVKELKAGGVGMVFISHRLEEIARIGDTVLVLRDGRLVAELPADTPKDELVRHMVGREVADHYPRRREYQSGGDALLEVRGLSRRGVLHDIDLKVYPGEVLGIAGLVGAGRTELIRAIAGADSYDTGEVTLAGVPVARNRIPAAIRAGMGHVPEDRKTQGLVLEASVGENIGFSTLSSSSKFGLADLRGLKTRAEAIAKQLRIRMRDINQPAGELSGGNQQKTVFARWMLAGSRVLLLDEPTRGVDVGARVEIYEVINEITKAGGAVVMVSSDLPEVIGMSDRIAVMSGGRIAGELDRAEATQDKVMALAVRNMSADVQTHTDPEVLVRHRGLPKRGDRV